MSYVLCSCLKYQRLIANKLCPECTSKGAPKAKSGKVTYKIPKQSPKARKQESDLSRIKKELLKESPVCFSSGETSNLTLSHIIPKTVKPFAIYKGNLVLECFHVHEIYEHNKALYAELYPAAWQEKLRRVKQMSTEHYQKLLNKVKPLTT
jgi:5-methylcytosine-specific restriction endonuclease McrA